MNEITCISPIDGKVFATRNTLSLKDAKDEIQRLRAAQSAWSARPLSERISLVMAGVEAIGKMNDQIVPELAKMMGRPVRYGGEFGGLFNAKCAWPVGNFHIELVNTSGLAK